MLVSWDYKNSCGGGGEECAGVTTACIWPAFKFSEVFFFSIAYGYCFANETLKDLVTRSLDYKLLTFDLKYLVPEYNFPV